MLKSVMRLLAFYHMAQPPRANGRRLPLTAAEIFTLVRQVLCNRQLLTWPWVRLLPIGVSVHEFEQLVLQEMVKNQQLLCLESGLYMLSDSELAKQKQICTRMQNVLHYKVDIIKLLYQS
jgi:hypothetical protein